MDFLKSYKIVLDMMPIIIDLIKKAEEMFPEKGTGKAKLQMVRFELSKIYDYGHKIPFETIWPKINKTIDFLVSVFKKTGKI